ncbi:MAG: MAPEG family protein [Paraglaciecola sp.]|uniref:MAPEG family protein n=1 Tax=Paraglaciecola sp. TaxID=1920173 RepID=UPI00273F565D|nr:MAPEG family protein [Paraglaciecola sp.]MDP5031901.1 MAPEG family protein [Paraglaciecola sp.]MDP5133535.1 MAPEG family protein [Paraglaciecola sp.]
MFTDYSAAFWAIFVAILTLIVQGLVAATSKASQPDAVPGKMDDSLSHSSFVFRSNRTFMNSLENFPAFLGSAVLAILVGASFLWTAVFLWIFAIARIIHMALYYAIATEKNPSPRSYFYLIALAANIALLALCGFTLI